MHIFSNIVGKVLKYEKNARVQNTNFRNELGQTGTKGILQIGTRRIEYFNA